MKTQIIDTNGNKAKEITTNLFEEQVREDLIFKIIEAQKTKQPYSNYELAGMDLSAAGNVRHSRHTWKTDRGRGSSRIPKKAMWRRGTQFSWIGAVIPGTRGGRRAHPPHGENRIRKINKKELRKALLSALTYASSIQEIKNKYSSIKDKELKIKLPIIVEGKITTLNTKELYLSLEKILGELFSVAIQKKTQRAGKGKARGRKNKKNAGLLIVIGKEEKMKATGIEIKDAQNLKIQDLAEGGARLTIFTENAIKELEAKYETNIK
ncbi:MAG: 50S ribosomal protein L4 [Candidatus Nanoarchaeia archaeon]